MAAKMDNQVDGNIAQKRSEKLITLASNLKREYMEKMLGKKETILIESQNSGYVQGYTPNYVMVKVKSNENLIGKQIKVTLKEIDKDAMFAII